LLFSFIFLDTGKGSAAAAPVTTRGDAAFDVLDSGFGANGRFALAVGSFCEGSLCGHVFKNLVEHRVKGGLGSVPIWEGQLCGLEGAVGDSCIFEIVVVFAGDETDSDVGEEGAPILGAHFEADILCFLLELFKFLFEVLVGEGGWQFGQEAH
jgi:hypothetical protein